MIRHNPIIKAFLDRLIAERKHKKAVNVACERKLVMICYGVLKSGKPIDPISALDMTRQLLAPFAAKQGLPSWPPVHRVSGKLHEISSNKNLTTNQFLMAASAELSM